MDNPIKDHKIAIIKGDGIGVDVVNEAVKVLPTISAKHQVHFQLTNYPWGSNYYFEHGMMAPEDFLDVLEQYDAILLGAVGHPMSLKKGLIECLFEFTKVNPKIT